MAMCIIGKSGLLSENYLNFGAAGYDAEQIRCKVWNASRKISCIAEQEETT